MRLSTFALTGFLLACSGLGTPEAVPTAPEVPPPAPAPAAPVLWEVVADPGAALHPARPFATIKAGSAQGLVVDTTLALVGPAPAVGGPQPVVGSARVTEVGADSARLVPVRLVDPLPASLAARSLLTEDQAALSAIPEVKPGGGGRRPGPAGGPAVGVAAPGGGAGLEIPDDLRTGSANDREDAVARYESRTDATAVIVWVMKNDPAESVRFKAWRVVRARWKKGIGEASEHEQAAAWLAANGSKDARLEAIAELGARSRNVERAAAQIDDGDPDIRAAAVKAVYEVGDRTGKRDKAREVLEERRGKESSAAVRSKIDALVGKL